MTVCGRGLTALDSPGRQVAGPSVSWARRRAPTPRVTVSFVTRDELVAHCLSKPGAYLDSPWGEADNVVKVSDKIFCFLGAPDGPPAITVKNTREAVQEWRDRFPEHVAVPRYLSKALWNQVDLASPGAPDLEDAQELIDDSYCLVVAGLPKSKRPD
jgi:predicted DNA-binding protein (MmcQ/YjbR family)